MQRLGRLDAWVRSHVTALAAVVVAGNAGLSLYYAWAASLNPDEAMHFLNANTSSWLQTYQRSLSTAHPPLFLLLLRASVCAGTSEVVLRLPSVVAGVAALWLVFRWVQRVAGDEAALAALLLLAASPAMLSAATEVRQYGVLLLGICGALYGMERFLEERSWRWLALHATMLYVAILSHYSAVWVVAAIGLHMLLRLNSERLPGGLVAAWAASQVGAAGLYAYLFITHLSRLRGGGMEKDAMSGWLQRGYYQPGEGAVGEFVSAAFGNAFGYLAGGPQLGLVAFTLFVIGVLLVAAQSPQRVVAVRRDYALLLALCPLLGCAGALAGLLPFGGTRHVTYLLPFVAAGIAIAATRLLLTSPGAVVAAGLIALPLWLASTSPANGGNRMQRSHMRAALAHLQENVPPSSVLFTDRETHLVLAYYLGQAEPDLKLPHGLRYQEQRIGAYRIVSSEEWHFSNDRFPSDTAAMSRALGLPPGQQFWIFAVRWSVPTAALDLPAGAVILRHQFGPIMIMQTAAGYVG